MDRSQVDLDRYEDQVIDGDWGPALQSAVDDLVDENPAWPDCSGGTLMLSDRRHTIKTTVEIRCPNVRIVGCGGPNSYVCTLEWIGDANGAMFSMIADGGTRRSHGFKISDVGLYGNRGSGIAFRFEQPKEYNRPFEFAGCGMKSFDCVFSFKNKGRARTWGGLSVDRCELSHNNQVIDAVDCMLNESRFIHCLMSKNGPNGSDHRYTIRLSGGSDIRFEDCVLEDQPRVIWADRVQGLKLVGCRFEKNATSNDPVCLFEDCNLVEVDCFNRVLKEQDNMNAPPIVEFRNCTNVKCDEMAGTDKRYNKYVSKY